MWHVVNILCLLLLYQKASLALAFHQLGPLSALLRDPDRLTEFKVAELRSIDMQICCSGGISIDFDDPAAAICVMCTIVILYDIWSHICMMLKLREELRQLADKTDYSLNMCDRV